MNEPLYLSYTADREIPVVDASRCTGCGDCPAVCPTTCLEMAGRLPWLPRPGHCVSCGLCVAICPAAALRMAATV
ncbi:MAG: 4Fe-4S dicluster domain-containing protein [Planctomycetes bacterium]|nr:4Fe-4S dicluster domain-containing protein [Planctomycetota bacterium]